MEDSVFSWFILSVTVVLLLAFLVRAAIKEKEAIKNDVYIERRGSSERD